MDNATEMIVKLDTLIKQSSRILVVCHTGADPDALSSLIATKEILKVHYGKETVYAVGERIPAALSFIPGYKDVVNGSILETLEKHGPDLIVCLDLGQIHLSSKFDAPKIKEFLTKAGIPIVVIDHHPDVHRDIDSDIYINVDPTSTAANLHNIFHKTLHFPILPKIADHLLFGIVADTNRFKYKYGAPTQATILLAASELLAESTLSVEQISNLMERFDLKMLQVVTTFIRNIKFLNATFAFTTISVDDLDRDNLDTTKLGDSAQYVSNAIISSVDTAQHGVVVYPHLLEENTYTARFRSCNPEFPVDKFAATLGGGGHPQSAAARIKALSVEEALEKVLAVVKKG